MTDLFGERSDRGRGGLVRVCCADRTPGRFEQPPASCLLQLIDPRGGPAVSRKPIIAAFAVAAMLPAGVAGAASTQKFDATLKGSSETPKSSSKATGSAEFTIAKNRKSIHYELNAKGLTGKPQAAHIHLGKPGQAGGVLLSIALKPFSPPIEGKLTSEQFTPVGKVKTFAQAIRAVRNGDTYVNIHTKKFGDGEIRGQIRPHS
jgi:hypothetical protein